MYIVHHAHRWLYSYVCIHIIPLCVHTKHQMEPMVLNLLLLGSVRCYVHISKTGEHYALCSKSCRCRSCCCVFSNIFGFNRFRVQPSFAYTVNSIWQFPSHQIYGYTTNIRLHYDEHSATAAFRIKLHCICHCCRQSFASAS